MSEKKKEVSISNWTMYGTQMVFIKIFEGSIDDVHGYQVGLGIVLDDGKNDETEEEKYITIFTNIFEKTPENALHHAMAHIDDCVFGRISDEYSVFAMDGKITRGSITEFMDAQEHDEDYEPYAPAKTKVTLH